MEKEKGWDGKEKYRFLGEMKYPLLLREGEKRKWKSEKMGKRTKKLRRLIQRDKEQNGMNLLVEYVSAPNIFGVKILGKYCFF